MNSISLLGSSAAFTRTLLLIEKLAKLEAPVLIEGETGTGKELAARAIHYNGVRREQPFVPINCGAFPEGLIEGELFGHMKGAFTDARSDQPGLVEAAAGGSLFLDEIDSLSPRGQVAMLRFLQDGSYRPVGGRVDRTADVRLIAASNAPMDELATSGAFRLDLLYRLRVLSLRMPPLRERDKDSLLLARTFFERCKRKYQCSAGELDESSCSWFARYHWPGNVRELEWLVYREAMLCEDATLYLATPLSLMSERRRGADRRSMGFEGIIYHQAKSMVVEQFERQYLTRLMKRSLGNVSQAARLAGKERRALGKLLKKYGIPAHEPK